jgi:excisionase family DNA binding protein
MPEPLLTTAEAAAYLRLTVQTLAHWRCRGSGPAYFTYGRRVRYSREDLDAWLTRQRTQPAPVAEPVSTPAPRPVVVLPPRHRRQPR